MSDVKRLRLGLSDKAKEALTAATQAYGATASEAIEKALLLRGTRKVFLVLEFEDGALASAQVFKTLDALIKRCT
jgi:hypothetical protein